jgi:hypothetical protein
MSTEFRLPKLKLWTPKSLRQLPKINIPTKYCASISGIETGILFFGIR